MTLNYIEGLLTTGSPPIDVACTLACKKFNAMSLIMHAMSGKPRACFPSASGILLSNRSCALLEDSLSTQIPWPAQVFLGILVIAGSGLLRIIVPQQAGFAKQQTI